MSFFRKTKVPAVIEPKPLELPPHPALAALSRLKYLGVEMDKIVRASVDIREGESASVSVRTHHKTRNTTERYGIDLYIDKKNKVVLHQWNED